MFEEKEELPTTSLSSRQSEVYHDLCEENKIINHDKIPIAYLKVTWLCEENKITNHVKIPIAYLKVTWLCEENKITIRRKNFASKFIHYVFTFDSLVLFIFGILTLHLLLCFYTEMLVA
ncbi:hypothetical protein C0J52_03528 [Blattella germanica]|nr:hypothetical protein C0J52_03528 [Blattella germanica]